MTINDWNALVMKAHSTPRQAMYFTVHRRVLLTRFKSRFGTDKYGRSGELLRRLKLEAELRTRSKSGQTAVWQARLIMLVMINIAQLWILAATIDAALARHYSVLLPLVIASGVCFLITLSIIKWWRPTSRKKTSTGYVRDDR